MHSIYVILFNYKKWLSILYSQLSYHCNRRKKHSMIFNVMVIYLLQYPPVLQSQVDCFMSHRHSPYHLMMVRPQGCTVRYRRRASRSHRKRASRSHRSEQEKGLKAPAAPDRACPHRPAARACSAATPPVQEKPTHDRHPSGNGPLAAPTALRFLRVGSPGPAPGRPDPTAL